MVTRPGTAREREIDFSAVGKVGRRTGTMLAQRPIDENGLEEISHIFSSPRKPSPLKRSISVNDVEENDSTPMHRLSVRKSIRNTPRAPLSVSPRKSGITGTARRSNGFDMHDTGKILALADPEEQENTPLLSSTRANRTARRFSPSPEKPPLRDITSRNAVPDPDPPLATQLRLQSAELQTTSVNRNADHDEYHHIAEADDSDADANQHEDLEVSTPQVMVDEDIAPLLDDGEYVEDYADKAYERLAEPSVELDTEQDAEEADHTSAPEPLIQSSTRERTKANSTRKRRSDVFEDDAEIPLSSPTLVKKSRKEDDQSQGQMRSSSAAESEMPSSKKPRGRGRPPGKSKQPKSQLSREQQREIDDIVEKVKARPGQNRSLYILRRETPADEGAVHTRSGRVSVKPLAYWRNERCVYGGSPGHAAISEGTRFPLNSIREIIRTEELQVKLPKKRGKQKTKSTTKSRQKSEASDSSESEQDTDSERHDPEAETWETEIGAFRGRVSVWDAELQAPIGEEEEIEIAVASAAIQTKEQKATRPQDGPSFRYAKLLSTGFFGTGLVDLVPGGIKRPKNSRKMHMSFFVVKGRVTVEVGPIDGNDTGSMNRFSIGKGGFWHVPRGNQYSIENELGKPARIFFSQGCEPSPVEE